MKTIIKTIPLLLSCSSLVFSMDYARETPFMEGDSLSEQHKDLATRTYQNFTREGFLEVQESIAQNYQLMTAKNPTLSEREICQELSKKDPGLAGKELLKDYYFQELAPIREGQYYILHDFGVTYEEGALSGTLTLYPADGVDSMVHQSTGVLWGSSPKMIGHLIYNSSNKKFKDLHKGLYIEHIEVNTAERGKGLAQEMIKCFLNFVSHKTPLENAVASCVNLKSENAFQKCGFSKISSDSTIHSYNLKDPSANLSANLKTLHISS